MKKILLPFLSALLLFCNFAAGRAFQEGKSSNQPSPQNSQPSGQACVGKSGEKLEKKDAEINSFVETITSFTDELVGKVDAAANPSAGVDEAQKFMDAQKPRMRARFVAVADIKECQVSEENKKNLSEKLYQNGVKVGQLQAKYGSDPAVSAKLRKLTQDFLDIFKTDEAAQSSAKSAEGAAAPCAKGRASGAVLEKNEAAINSFLTVINAFTDELVRRVDSASTPAAGVDEAQKYLDAEKANLKSQFDAVKNIGECTVSEATQKRVSEDFYQNGVKIGQLQVKYGSDSAVKAKLQKLAQDYLELFKM